MLCGPVFRAALLAAAAIGVTAGIAGGAVTAKPREKGYRANNGFPAGPFRQCAVLLDSSQASFISIGGLSSLLAL